MIKQVTFDRSNRRRDRSISMTFTTTLEQDSKEFMEIDSLLGAIGLIYFKSSGDLTQKEIDEIDNTDIEAEGKTQSQRLRSVLYVLWKQEGKGDDFKEFYKNRTESIIQQIKNRLDD